MMLTTKELYYTPTENDLFVIENWNKIYKIGETEEETRLLEIIPMIYHYDHYWDYSDDASVRRNSQKTEDKIKQYLKDYETKDPDLVSILKTGWNEKTRDSLLEHFPWLKNRYSLYAIAFKRYGFTEKEASFYLALWIHIDQLTNMVRQQGGYGHVVYATNFEKATRILRKRHTGEGVLYADMDWELPLEPITVSNDLIPQLKELTELFEGRDHFSKLRTLVGDHAVGVQYKNGFTLYKVNSDFYLMVNH